MAVFVVDINIVLIVVFHFSLNWNVEKNERNLVMVNFTK